MLATRELECRQACLESSRNWINDKLIYKPTATAITMNPVNGSLQKGFDSST